MSERRVEEWFERFRSHGDAAALGRVFDEVAPVLQRVARHIAHDRAEAEDLVQATFLAAIEKRDAFDATRKLEPWLTGILLKQASLVRRARARVIEADRLDSRASEDPLDVAGAREMSESLAVALAKLKPADREVLLPLLLDGRRAVEIARELGRRPDTVSMRIHRGLARLRRLLPASFAVVAVGRTSHARGLGAVKAEVLRRASSHVGAAGGAGASIATVTWGIAMTTKQIAVAATILVVALSAGGYWLTPHLHGASADASRDRTVEIALPLKDATASTGEGPAAPAAISSTRTELSAVATPGLPRTIEIELVRGDQHPAAGALVALVDAPKSLSVATADGKGTCRFTTAGAVADVYVRDDGSLPCHEHVDLGDKEKLKVVLPDGGELSGRLIMIGNELLPDVELKLSTESAPEGFAQADLAVFKALELMRYDSKEIVARTHPLANGTFRFRGLPPGWNGALSLPGELVFVVQGVETASSEQVFHSPAVGLDIPVTFRPRIIGRFVDAQSGHPITNAEVDGTIHWSNGNDMGIGFVSDQMGRFTIPLDYKTDAIGLRIARIRASNGAAGRATASLESKGPCTPFDAGDIACTFPSARELVIHVVDPDGNPLGGAHAGIRDLGNVSADEKGYGKFEAVPYEASQMRVVAPGHAIVTVPISKETASPLTVMLPPTNALTITVPPEAGGNQGFRVALVSRPLLFGGTNRMYDSILRGGMVGRCWSADGDAGTKEGSVRFAFSDDGRIELEDIRTGVPFRIQLRTEMDTEAGIVAEVKVDSLGPHERRLVQFTPSDLSGHPMRFVRGRVTDQDGRPLLGARVGSRIASGSFSVLSDFDGTFRLNVHARESTDVEVWKRGYVPFRIHDWAVQPDKFLDVRLRPAQDLRVECVDSRGHPIASVDLHADVEGHGAPTIEGIADGMFNLLDMPEGTVHLDALVAGKHYSSSADCRAGVARITLPEHGRLEVTWKDEDHQEPNLWLMLRPTGTEGAEQLEHPAWTSRIPTYVFKSVLPGDYTIGFETGESPDDEFAHTAWTKRSDPIRIRIEAGKTRSVVIPP